MNTKVQLVIPVHNEKEALPLLLSEIEGAFIESGIDLNVVVVDDGSTDGSALLAEDFFRGSPIDGEVRKHVKRLGQTRAIKTGLRTSDESPRFFATCDGDGQDNPDELRKLIKHIASGKADMVYGVRSERRDPRSKKMFSMVANRLFSRTLGHEFQDLSSPMKVFSRELAASLDISGNDHRYLPVMAICEGYLIEGIPVIHRPRFAGKSKYGLGRALNFIEDVTSLISHVESKVRPLRLPSLILGFSAFLGALALGWAISAKLIAGDPLTTSPIFFFGLFSAWNALLMLFIALLFRR